MQRFESFIVIVSERETQSSSWILLDSMPQPIVSKKCLFRILHEFHHTSETFAYWISKCLNRVRKTSFHETDGEQVVHCTWLILNRHHSALSESVRGRSYRGDFRRNWNTTSRSSEWKSNEPITDYLCQCVVVSFRKIDLHGPLNEFQ